MTLLRFVTRRLILSVPMLLGITLVLFVIYNIVQVDPLVMIVGERAMDNPEIVEAAVKRWGLDRPKVEQYFTYLGNLLQGDLGTSFLTRRPVLDDLRLYLPMTIELAITSLAFAIVLGIPLGILAGIRYGGIFDSLGVADHAYQWIAAAILDRPIILICLLLPARHHTGPRPP